MIFYKKRAIIYSGFFLIPFFLTLSSANALQYDHDRFSIKLNGYGTAGILEPDFDKPDFIGDWRLRSQLSYDITSINILGLVYAIDAAAIDEDKFMREAFGYWENRNVGRIEIGFTDSVARKLSVGLPDVGGLRINDKPLFYKKISPDGPVISDTIITTGRSALRTNIVSVSDNGIQYGFSFASLTDDYDYAIDAGLKFRQPNGKVKTAFSLGASFMDKPDGYRTDAYTPIVNADWRAQISSGFNLQYNSWLWGISARLIYDEKPIGPVSDGVVAGTGISYDLLKYSISFTYLFSDTGIWNKNVKDYMDHTGLISFRYKYSENIDGWMSLGVTTETPFLAVGMRLTF